jgi:hypothetical protein
MIEHNIELEWQSFEFYVRETEVHESSHMQFIKTIQNFIDANPNPKPYQRKRLISKSQRSTDILLQLYKKQLDCLDKLIDFHSKNLDISIEREVDVNSLLTLKNTTKTLLYQINHENQKIIKILQ